MYTFLALFLAALLSYWLWAIRHGHSVLSADAHGHAVRHHGIVATDDRPSKRLRNPSTGFRGRTADGVAKWTIDS